MTDKELIARLRKADEYEPLGHDGWEAADRIEALVKQAVMDKAAYEGVSSMLLSVQEDCIKERQRAERLEAAADYILDGMGIDAPDYEIDPDDDFLDAANSDWVRDVLTRLAATLTQKDRTDD